MDVFIGNLPMQATLHEVRSFFEGLELKASFDCRRGLNNEQDCYLYLIARTKTQGEGLALIERLNGLIFHDKALIARPLVARQPSPETPDEDRRLNPENSDDSIPLYPDEEIESQNQDEVQVRPTPKLTLISGSGDKDMNCAEPVAAAL